MFESPQWHNTCSSFKMPVPTMDNTNNLISRMSPALDNNHHHNPEMLCASIERFSARHEPYAENMILVQVNPGETFTIQDDATYRSISGPAQVPMVLHNGTIPPILVPPGYISRVIEENGVRRVVVLPSGNPALDGHPGFVGTPTIQPHHFPVHSFHPSQYMHPTSTIFPHMIHNHPDGGVQLIPQHTALYLPEEVATVRIAPESKGEQSIPVSRSLEVWPECLEGSSQIEVYQVTDQQQNKMEMNITDQQLASSSLQPVHYYSPVFACCKNCVDVLPSESSTDQNIPEAAKSRSVGLQVNMYKEAAPKYPSDNSVSSSEDSSHSTGAAGSPAMHPSGSPQAKSHTQERLQKKLHKRQQQQQKQSDASSHEPSSVTSSPSSSSSFVSSQSPSPDPQALSFVTNGHLPLNPHQQQQQQVGGKSPLNLSPEHFVPHYVGAGGVNFANVHARPVFPNFALPQGVIPMPMPHRNNNSEEPAFEPPLVAKEGNVGAVVETPLFSTLAELLDSVAKPEVRDLQPRRAHVTWPAVPLQRATDELRAIVEASSNAPLSFELQLSHRKRDSGKFHVVYSGTERYHELCDLRPGSEYHVRVLACCSQHRGSQSEACTFLTLSSEPDAPPPPKVTNRTKNSLVLKWTAPLDNGEKIIKYHLEWDEGTTAGGGGGGQEFRSLFSNSQKQYKVTKLQPARSYRFRLAAENKIGRSPWSAELSCQTSGTVPSSPDAPRLVKATVRTLTLQWVKATSDISSFILEKNDETSGYGFTPVYNGPDTKYTLTNLNRSSHYRFRLCSQNIEGKSKWSETVSYLTCPDKPQAPGKPKVKGNAHARFFKVTWDAPRDNGGSEVGQYVMEMSRKRNEQMDVVYTGAEQECLVDDLEPGHTYRLRVFCQTNGGISAPSEVAMVTTPPVIPGACAAPMLALRPKPSCLTVKWDPPPYEGGSPVTHYEVSCHPSEPASDPSPLHQGPELDHTAGSLKPGTRYTFHVRPLNKVGIGPWSDPLEVVTSAGTPDKVNPPDATVLSPTSVHLQWQEPLNNGAEITSYRVNWGCPGNAMSVHPVGPSLTHQFHGLAPNTAYLFTVQAVNAVGQGAVSDVGTVTTPPSRPDRVTNLRQTTSARADVDDDAVQDAPPLVTTARSAAVEWEAPSDNGSDIVGYRIHVVERSSRSRKRKDVEEQVEEEEPQGIQNTLFEVEPDVTLYCIEDLRPDTKYSVKVCALNHIGCGEFSETTEIRTRALPPEPPVLTCVQATASSLKLKWSDLGDVRYLLQMRDKNGRYSTPYRGSSSSHRVHRLAEDSTYRFRINASNSAGEGHFSADYSFSTVRQMPPVIEAPVASSIEPSSCEVSWQKVDPIKGDPMQYRLLLEKIDDPSSRTEHTCVDTSYHLDRLAPGTNYRMRVATVRSYLAQHHNTTSSNSSRSSNSGASAADDSSSTSSDAADEAVSYLQSDFSASCTFATPESDIGAVESDEIPRLTPKVAPPPAVKGDAQAIVGAIDNVAEHSCEEASALYSLESISDNKLSAIWLAVYLLSAILMAFAAQSYFVK